MMNSSVEWSQSTESEGVQQARFCGVHPDVSAAKRPKDLLTSMATGNEMLTFCYTNDNPIEVIT